MTAIDSAISSETGSAAGAEAASCDQRVGAGESFFVRTVDGRVLNSAEFLDLPAFGQPTVSTAIPKAPTQPRRTRYTRAVENLRAAYQAQLKAEKKAKKAARKAAKKTKQQAELAAKHDQPETSQHQQLPTGSGAAVPSPGAPAVPGPVTIPADASAPSPACRGDISPAGPKPRSDHQGSGDRRGGPRANTGASTPADTIRHEEITSSLATFTDAYRARAAADASQLRALANAYEIALERAIAELTPTTGKKQEVRFDDEDQQRVFSWHLTSIIGEYAIATNDTDQALRGRAGDANLLTTAFPAWLDALEAGRIDLRHIQGLLKHGRQLPNEHQPEYGAVVLEFALANTPRQTSHFAEEAAATIAATAFEETHANARAARNVSVRHDGLGMAALTAYIPSELATPAVELLERGARELRELDNKAAKEHARAVAHAREHGLPEPVPFQPDTRTMAQLRTDLLIETLLCAAPGESRVTTTVSVTVPALSLLDAERAAEQAIANGTVNSAAGAGWRADGHGPALLNGMVPMSIEQARQFASDSSFLQRILIHPITGQVTAVDKYEMCLGMRRFLEIRDRTCRFPGCIRPAERCDADHTHPYSEHGLTDVENLAHLCRGHHVQKHHKPWTVTNLGGGVLEWRTPQGQVATTRPRPYGPVFVPTWEYGPPPF
ncbi:HNH endonuclease signature motif containing protein [Gulosibacter chungangensis]|uniref:HNH endonuclease n=1 Tax=Gulosibacter chungangensis TaxID=979746 RepID=A0A7J5B933_9MICO|nr:HNH endonuclease signature motif containing protein [Gulosibacter chungangensis]KAB1641924.1 HNH endonuclease [Gulosibacter chungangensis]